MSQTTDDTNSSTPGLDDLIPLREAAKLSGPSPGPGPGKPPTGSKKRFRMTRVSSLLAPLVRAILGRACRQRGICVTAGRLSRAFSFLQAVDLVWGDSSVQRRAAEMTDSQAQVLHTFGAGDGEGVMTTLYCNRLHISLGNDIMNLTIVS